MEHTFTIPVSFDEFVIWLNGHTRRTNVLPAQVMTLDGRTSATVTAHGAQYAFTVQDEDDARATLHAELWSRTEPAPEAKKWFAGAVIAIHLKWPPAADSDDLARKIAHEIVWEQRRLKRIDDLIEGIITAADTDQTTETTSEGSKPGPRGLRSHADAIQRLHEGQERQANYAQWCKEYEAETGKDPNKDKTPAWEKHKKSVWQKYQKEKK